MNVVKWSSLAENKTVKELLLEHFSLSKQKLKSFSLSKKFLDSMVKRRMVLELPLSLVNNGQVNPTYTGPLIEIIFEDDTFLVLNKPVGIHSHPLNYEETDNCLSFVRSIKGGNTLMVNPSSYERGLIHRLDLPTSGVLILAKRQNDWDYIRENFHLLVKEKKYQAIVRGHFTSQGDLKSFLKQIPGKERVLEASEGKLCEANYQLLQYYPEQDYSLVEVKLETGFRHQIRAQLMSLGFPIIGDELYGGEKGERVYLHSICYQLNFKGKDYCFRSESGFELLLNLNRRL